jgi:hypothetical protein
MGLEELRHALTQRAVDLGRRRRRRLWASRHNGSKSSVNRASMQSLTRTARRACRSLTVSFRGFGYTYAGLRKYREPEFHVALGIP